jgi:hypothetical protein
LFGRFLANFVNSFANFFVYYFNHLKTGVIMNKLKSLTNPVSVLMMLAMAFAVSCSSDDGNNSGEGNSSSDYLSTQLSGVSMQVYMNNVEYNGNGDIKIVLNSDTLDAGKIQNGKITLSLQETIDSKYLEDFDSPCEEEDYKSCDIHCTEDLTSASAEFQAIISGKNCNIRLSSAGGAAGAGFTYFSKAGKVEGTLISENTDRTTNATYDINILKGWNIFWVTSNRITENSFNVLISTSTTPAVKNSLKWQATNCEI